MGANNRSTNKQLNSLKRMIAEIMAAYSRDTRSFSRFYEMQEILPVIMGILETEDPKRWEEEYKDRFDEILGEWETALRMWNSQYTWKAANSHLLRKVRVPVIMIGIKEGLISPRGGMFTPTIQAFEDADDDGDNPEDYSL